MYKFSIPENFECASVWQKLKMVVLVFCGFMYMFFITALEIIQNLFKVLGKLFQKHEANLQTKHHCEQVEQMQQSLQQILEQQKKQDQSIQLILDYLKLNNVNKQDLHEWRKQFERQYNEPIINQQHDNRDSDHSDADEPT